MIVPRSDFADKLPTWGCDPEGLIRNPKGQIVEATAVVPPDGLIRKWGHFSETEFKYGWPQQPTEIPVLFPDGVQLEFNVNAYDCVAYTVNALAQSMRLLRTRLNETGHTLDLQTRAEMVDAEIWNGLSTRGRQLGSLPSYNAYPDEKPLEVTEENERLRTGAGHIHFGYASLENLPLETLGKLAIACDVLIGLPSVLLDPDPGNATRRTMYGRAGEFRPQPHGFEYRTPSNYWLSSGPLAGFIFGAARFALAVFERDRLGKLDMLKEFERFGIDLALVRQAINTNDVALAWKCFEGIEKFYSELNGSMDGLWARCMPQFKWFAQQVQEKGMAHFWPDTLEHWCSLPEAHDYGWTWWMTRQVPKLMKGQTQVA